MKKLLIIIFTATLIICSCTNRKKGDTYLFSIEKIENSLLPPLVIEGNDKESYNIHDRMRHYKVPGVSIAFIDNGKIIWAKGYGHTTFDSTIAINENTMFQAASISKPIAALAALALVEKGEISLDENVNDYLVEWKVPDNKFTEHEKVTLRRLLTHSAGLTVHGFGGYSSDDDLPTLVQVLNGEDPSNSGAIYPDIIPGSENRYSGGGYTVMQKMLIDITGKSFPELLNEMVISKIGMINSTYEQPLPKRFQAQAAPAHLSNGEMVKGKWHIYPEMAAAGLWTTPSDLLRYALEVQKSLAGNSNLILSRKMTGEMLTKQIVSQGLGPGLGGEGDSLTFGHGGANEGYRCQFVAFARLGQGVAVMTNSDNGGLLISEILRSVSYVYGWSVIKPKKKTLYAVEADKLINFTGKFKWDQEELVAEIFVEGDHLKGIQLWDSQTFEMFPESELKFFNKEDGASFEFKKDENGIITEILIQGAYRFVRMD